MIQRIQSIFLLLASLIMIAVLFLPLWSETSSDGTETVSINSFELVYTQNSELTDPEVISAKPTWYISVLALIAAIVAMISIFQFRNRLTQMKLGALNSLFMGGTVALIYFFSTKGEPIIPNHQGSFEIGFFIVVAALLFNSLANRFIRKDEKLVRSADRIR